MFKKAFIFALLVSTAVKADCPELKHVIPQLKKIHDHLKSKSSEPLAVKGIMYTVVGHPKGDAAIRLLEGDYRGYKIDRLVEKELGTCLYVLRDDNTPARGTFTLKKTGKK